ncbi:hypothetical protein NLI96_g7299 [Meripilus lineatus]|uniref:F-box domain-containing protein n=1 Tax=Meripilus lineatus TaxID=2056292 RepID=A0AAD5YD33_9APHY|nr:hypothetical protein NLI96_g7299 [Physisporinus lineatus]
MQASIPMDLPQELINLIIDFVAAGESTWDFTVSPESLEACSLTCRAWRDRSQYHIHREKMILFSFDYRNLPKVLLHPPRILQMIRHIVLEFAGTTHNYPSQEEWNLISKFTNLRALSLHGSEIPSGVNQDNLKPLEAPFNNVTNLQLLLCTFQNSSDFLSFVAAFPRVQILSLSDVRLIDTVNLRVIPSNAPQPTLRELSIFEPVFYGVPFFELCGCWLSALPVEVLRTVKLEVLIDRKAPCVSLQPIFQALGPHLHHLAIDSEVRIRVNELPALKYCTSLRTLQINQQSYAWSLSLVILKSIHASTISDVTIRFMAKSYFATDGRLFSSIDETLSQTRFRDTQTVNLVLYGDDTLTPRSIQKLKGKFPTLASKLLFKFEF